MQLGFVTALTDEARTLSIPDNENTRKRAHAIEISGVGIDNAARASLRLLEGGAEGLISWGTAGALDPQLLPGSLVIYDATHTISGDAYRCDPAWCAKLFSALSMLNPIEGSGFTSAHAIASTREKGAIRDQFHCAALDMESAAVGARASAAGVPFVAVRAIVDPADFDIPQTAISALAHGGEPRAWPMVRGLLRRPQELPALLKLARWYRLSLANLTLAATALQPDFGQISATVLPTNI
jgi:adenosylhomocysteine nucleosidase